MKRPCWILRSLTKWGCKDFFEKSESVSRWKERGDRMKISDVKRKARALDVDPGKMKKPDLIRAIQKAEGNTPCFGSAAPDCPQTNCCWREDCMA